MKPAKKQLAHQDQLPVSHITNLSEKDTPSSTDFPDNDQPPNNDLEMWEIIFGKTGQKATMCYSADMLILEALPEACPLQTALQTLMTSLDNLNEEFQREEQKLFENKQLLKEPAPTSQKAKELTATLNKLNSIFKKIFKTSDRNRIIQELACQNATDQAMHIEKAQTRIRHSESYLNQLALKITLHQLRLRELIEEYLEILGKLSQRYAESIEETDAHVRILTTYESLH